MLFFWGEKMQHAAPPTQVTTTIEADGRGEGDDGFDDFDDDDDDYDDDDDDDDDVVVVVVPHETNRTLKSLYNIQCHTSKYQHISNLRVWWSESLITWLTRSVKYQDGVLAAG